jgi:hypothetical protein
MARHAQQISVGNDNTQHLSLGLIALCFPLVDIQRIINECGKASQRIRDLPAAVVAYYVIGLSLFPSAGYQAVLGWLLSGLNWLRNSSLPLSGKSALSMARSKLGAEPMRRAFMQLVRPLLRKTLPGSFWKGFHLVAIDGSTFALQDTAENAAAFGYSTNQNGRGAYPLARFVALVEVGTHVLFGASLGAYKQSELALARDLMPELREGMLCMADRLFPSFSLWQAACATGAHLVWRSKTRQNLRRIKTLPDGSWLAEWREKRKNGPMHIVRVVEYRLSDGTNELYRLITTILDPAVASAQELAELYPQRWEIELSVREVKGVLRQGQITLRSKTPELVKQEFWGLLMAHYIVRKMMTEAADTRGVDPDKLSFKNSVEIIRQYQTGPVRSFSPAGEATLVE